MEDLRKQHRQELKDLQSQITQKKKSATKKTRKGVNDECAELERRLKTKQQSELSGLSGNGITPEENSEGAFDDMTEPPQEMATEINGPINALPVSDEPPNPGTGKKPNRQKARLARRAAEQEAAAAQAAEEAEDLPNLRSRERDTMREHYTSRGLKEQDIRPDGHCLYAAIADQLLDANIGLQPRINIRGLDTDGLVTKTDYAATRQVAASYISANPDDFAPFLEEPLGDYVRTIRETGEWGGHLELMALAKAYDVNINVLHGNGQVDTIESASQDDAKSLWLAYYRHSFGLGEHYNSLRKSEQHS
ncbi:MAG: hypothetical protein HETSPECPRED_002343 [Heterodermia speciosa]|uniref:OTU domain-containing protein n=1 Tax=Heterodermia speciosa TaxID=116794 RepID=A0A8H3F0G0_9LECA|nr:MAG: hypothetical protein HETSPECPRED_002343 [Heterodermia speciosa]